MAQRYGRFGMMTLILSLGFIDILSRIFSDRDIIHLALSRSFYRNSSDIFAWNRF